MARDLNISITSTADTAGVDKAKKAVADLGTEAKQASAEIGQTGDKLEELKAEMRGKFAQADRQLDALGNNAATPPPLPDAEGGVGAAAGLVPAAAIAAASIAVIKSSIAEMRREFEAGLKSAVDLNEQLSSLPADKAAALRAELGPVADLLDENSAAIAAYAQANRDAELKAQNFWTTIAVRAIPSLNELRDAQQSIDIQPLAEGLGNVVGGAAGVGADSIKFLNIGLDDLQKKTVGVGEGILRSFNPALTLAIAALEEKGRAAADAAAAEQANRDAIAGVDDEWAARNTAAAEIAKARTAALEAQLPAEERLAALRERQAGLIEQAATGDTAAIAEAAAIEKTAVALQAQIDKQAEANRLKEEAAATALAAFETQVQITEAIASGNTAEAERLKYAQDYAAALRSSGGNEDRATRMADAQAKIRDNAQAERDASEAQKQKAAAEAQAEREALAAAKKEERDLEVAIAEAKALGNKEEAAKLEWLKQYNALQARGYSEDQARRLANADSVQSTGTTAAYVPPGTDPGELVSGTRRRRGLLQGDASFEDVPLGQSKLDQYLANQSRPVGSINGQSILGADPTSSAKGGNAQGLNAAAEKLNSSESDVSGLGDQMAASLDKVIAAAEKKAGDLEQLKSGLQSANAKIDALAAKI